MSVLKNAREEQFARYRAQGLSQTKAALEAGYSASRAASQGCQLAARPRVNARIAELREKVAQESARQEHQIARTIVVTKDWAIEQLWRNVQDARADQQYSTVKSTIELMAKIADVYIERQNHRHEVLDLSLYTDEEIDLLLMIAKKQPGAKVIDIPRSLPPPAAPTETKAEEGW